MDINKKNKSNKNIRSVFILVKISELRQTEIRTKFNYIGADKAEHEVIIYNPTPEARQKLLDIVGKNMDEDSDMFVTGEEMLRMIFPMLTNIEIDVDDIQEVLDNPTKVLMMANVEIQTIINEIVMEITLASRLEYEQMLVTLEQVKGLNMIQYIKMKADEFKPLRDFDPLNSNEKEARDRISLNEAKQALEATKEVYTKLKEEEKEADK